MVKVKIWEEKVEQENFVHVESFPLLKSLTMDTHRFIT